MCHLAPRSSCPRTVSPRSFSTSELRAQDAITAVSSAVCVSGRPPLQPQEWAVGQAGMDLSIVTYELHRSNGELSHFAVCVFDGPNSERLAEPVSKRVFAVHILCQISRRYLYGIPEEHHPGLLLNGNDHKNASFRIVVSPAETVEIFERQLCSSGSGLLEDWSLHWLQQHLLAHLNESAEGRSRAIGITVPKNDEASIDMWIAANVRQESPHAAIVVMDRLSIDSLFDLPASGVSADRIGRHFGDALRGQESSIRQRSIPSPQIPGRGDNSAHAAVLIAILAVRMFER